MHHDSVLVLLKKGEEPARFFALSFYLHLKDCGLLFERSILYADSKYFFCEYLGLCISVLF